jgi:hypothetical protein
MQSRLCALLWASALALPSWAGTARATERTVLVTPERPLVVRGNVLPAGTRLIGELNEPIGVRLQVRGSRFTAGVRQPIVDATGRTLVPRGTPLIGHVVALETRNNDVPISMRVVIDGIHLPGVSTVTPLSATVIGTRAVRTRRGEPPVAPVYRVGGEYIGAIVGRPAPPPVGTRLALGAGDAEPQVPKGSWLMLTLDRPLQVG